MHAHTLLVGIIHHTHAICFFRSVSHACTHTPPLSIISGIFYLSRACTMIDVPLNGLSWWIGPPRKGLAMLIPYLIYFSWLHHCAQQRMFSPPLFKYRSRTCALLHSLPPLGPSHHLLAPTGFCQMYNLADSMVELKHNAQTSIHKCFSFVLESFVS